VSDELPKVYYTASNGEAVFEQTVLDNLSKGNIKYESLALEGTVPEDADCIILSNPSKDLTTAQLNALNKYLDKGGRVFVIYNNNPSLDMPNLKTLLKSFGLKNNEGVVLEGDTSLMFKYNGSAVPYVIYSETEKDSLGAELEQMELKPIFQLSTGIGYEDGLDGSIDFTEICMSSDTSFIRPYSSSADSYSKAEGDIGGPICLAVMAEKKTESGTSKLVWLASDDFADASMDDFANGGNSGLISAVTAHLTEKTVNTARAKTIGYDAMEINNVQRTSIAILLIAVVPALFVCYGIYVSKKRKMR
jgi:ABC-2 type transport system permease protein